MKNVYSVEVDKYNPEALIYCLQKLKDGIPNFEYDWNFRVNAGGIDYGIFLNINVKEKEVEICNQPYHEEAEDLIDDILELFEEEEEDE